MTYKRCRVCGIPLVRAADREDGLCWDVPSGADCLIRFSTFAVRNGVRLKWNVRDPQDAHAKHATLDWTDAKTAVAYDMWEAAGFP